MTKQGYTHIQVPTELYEALKLIMQTYKISMAKLIRQLLETSLKTSLMTTNTDTQN